MAGVRKKGQTFIIGAVIMVSLVIMIFTSYSNFFTQPSTDETQRFFERTLQEPGNVFSQSLEENYSAENALQELYSWNSFIKTQAREKGMEYRAVHVFAIPDKGKAVLINYQDTEQQLNLKINNNSINTEIGPQQHIMEDFSGNKASVELSLEDKSLNQSFETYNPRMLTFVQISSGNERWRNHIVN